MKFLRPAGLESQRIAVFSVLLILLQFTPSALAVFKHEAYKTDWQHALLGPPVKDSVFFASSSSSSQADAESTTSIVNSTNSTKILFALGDRNVLGAIHPARGQALWRRPFDEDQKLIVRKSPSGVLVGHEDGIEELSSTGHVTWTSAGKVVDIVVAPAPALDAPAAAPGEGAVFVLGDTTVKRVEAGITVWESSLSTTTPLRLALSDHQLFVISLVETTLGHNTKIRVDVHELETGKHNRYYTLGGGSDGPKCSGCILFVGGGKDPIIAWKDAAHEHLKFNVLGHKKVHTSPIEVPAKEELKSVSVHLADPDAHTILVHYSTEEHFWTRALFLNERKDEVVDGFSTPKRPGKAAFAVVSGGATTDGTADGQPCFIRVTKNHLSVLDNRLGVVAEWEILEDAKVDPIHASGEVVRDISGAVHARAAVLSSDGVWSMIQDGDKAWSRPEFLAWTVSAVLADPSREPDLVRELELEGEASIMEAYVHRLSRHLTSLKEDFVPWIMNLPQRFPEILASLVSIRGSNDAKKFGYDKTAVLATKSGRVSGLSYAQEGAVVWTTDLRTVEPHADWSAPRVAVIASGVVAVRSAEKNDSDAHVVHLSVTDGKPLLNEDVMPFSATVLSRLLEQDSAEIVYHAVSEDRSLVNGYRTPVSAFGSESEARHHLESDSPPPLWTFAPPPGETVVSVLQRPPHDPTASIGRMLGDRTVLYKYLNPNILLVTSLCAADHRVTFSILDGISGRVLHATTHDNVDTDFPVVSIVRENWVASSFSLLSDEEERGGNDKDDGNEAGSNARRIVVGPVLTFTDLYESSVSNDRGPFGDSVQNASVLEQPDFPNPAPHIRSAMFTVSGDTRPIVALSASVTQQGITARQLLALSADGATPASLYAIPISLLDPRHPVGRDPNSEEAIEGLMRYNPVLRLLPTWSLTHRREVLTPVSVSDPLFNSTTDDEEAHQEQKREKEKNHGHKHGQEEQPQLLPPALNPPAVIIRARQTELESTSVILLAGLDVVGTRVAPSGGFDYLPAGEAGFDKKRVVVSILALAVAVVMIGPRVAARKVGLAWGQ